MFRLPESFVEPYRRVPARLGFGGLGQVVYARTYSRLKEDGTNERWHETVRRVVEGSFTLQRDHHRALGDLDPGRRGMVAEGPSDLPCDGKAGPALEAELEGEARATYDALFHCKFLPAGRGLWAMGTPIVHERRVGAALYSCAFVSTGDAATCAAGPSDPFRFLMNALMLGTGCGVDVRGATAEPPVIVRAPGPGVAAYVVEDTREAWVESTCALLDSYLVEKTPLYEFDYSRVRPAGLPLACFGGRSSGPEPLVRLHEQLREVLEREVGRPLSARAIADVTNLIGVCVVSGNIRRSAEILLGDATPEFLDLKDYNANPERAAFGHVSNNSVLGRVGMDFGEVARRVRANGEPGVIFLEHVRRYGRMGDAPRDDADPRAMGCNPCGEIPLENRELCLLAEVFLNKIATLPEFLRVLELAHRYAKSVTLVGTTGLGPRTDEVIARNRRIGLSLSGVRQFLARHSLATLREWMERGYAHLRARDEALSREWRVPRSHKLTTVKPSGTISILAGATSGLHTACARFYVRRVRLAANSPLLEPLRAAGFPTEPCCVAPGDTVVVSFPVDCGDVPPEASLGLWEQLSLVAFCQRHWSDNMVSATVTFDAAATSAEEIACALDYFSFQLKGVSLLPRFDAGGGAYKQLPHEPISAAEYRAMVAALRPLRLDAADEDTHDGDEVYCDGDRCTL